MPYFHANKNLFKHGNKFNKTKKNPFSQRRNGNILCEQHVSQSMCFYDDVFRLKGGWVGIPPFFRAALPTLNHCVHPPKRWGIQTGAPETKDRKT